MTQVLVIEPNSSLAIKLRQHSQVIPDLSLVGTASSLADASAAIERLQPDIVVLDQSLPGNALQVAQEIRDRSATIKVLILGIEPESIGINQALSVGANGYLLRETSSADVVKAIQGAAKGYFQTISAFDSSPKSGFFSLNGRAETVEVPRLISTLSPLTDLQPVQTGFAQGTPFSGVETDEPSFDRAAILKPSPVWWRLLTWCLLLLSGGLFAWATFFEIEEAIPAQGQLEPEGAVREVQAPVAGVVQSIYIKDGQAVRQGDVLFQLDRNVNQSQLVALQKIRAQLVAENQFYQSQLGDARQLESLPDGIPLQMLSLTRSRQALMAENEYFRTQIQGGAGENLSADQRLRLRSNQQEQKSRLNSADLEIEKLEKQLQQADIQLTSTEEILSVNRGILADIEPVQKEGAISKVQYLRQYQEVKRGEGEIKRLLEEKKRLMAQIAQVREEMLTIKSTHLKDLTAQLSDNERRIAEIDSQITKSIVENQKQIEDIDSRISRTRSELSYQEVKAPVSGIIFDLKPKAPGFVTNASEILLKIVPSEVLVAKVYITNQDIGFVRSKMPVDVRIDAYPFSEFGDLKGSITWLGSDVLPPTEIRPFYSFPATVSLNRQRLDSRGRQLPLQSGMAVSVNVKIRKRTVMSIFTEFFAKEADHLKYIR